MEDITARRAAEALLAEHKANVRFRTIGPPDGPASISDAYDIQERYVALLRGEHGDAVGYKVGLTSATMQKFCGIDHPIAGAVLGRATRDSAAIGEGHGRDILGHPFNSAAWLATQLNSRGVGLKAGQVVMTGSVMKTGFPEEDAGYRFELDGIGSVEVLVR